MGEILVITSPSSKQCMALIPLLYNKTRFRLRLAAPSESVVEKLKADFPNAEVIESDISSPGVCRQLLSGASAVFHVGPAFDPREKEIGINMVDAAVAESQRPGNVFRHFVFSSVLGALQQSSLMQHEVKGQVEKRLLQGPLNYTILQPTILMDVYPIGLLAAQGKPTFEKPWASEVPNSLISLRDLADATFKVLREGKPHFLAQYPLCSTMPISDREVVKEIGKQVSKEVEFKTPMFDIGVQKTPAHLLGRESDFYGSDLVRVEVKLPNEGTFGPDMSHYEAERLLLSYNRRGFRGSPSVLRWLLGREPTTVEEYVRLELKQSK